MTGMSLPDFDSMLAREVDEFMGDGNCDDHDPNDKFCECCKCVAERQEAAEDDQAEMLADYRDGDF